VNPWQAMHAFEVLDHVAVIPGLAYFGNAQILYELSLGHQFRSTSRYTRPVLRLSFIAFEILPLHHHLACRFFSPE
jgi:hypothetical protein